MSNIRPELVEIVRRHQHEPLRLKTGGLVRHAERLRQAGRYGDRHLVHLNDDELQFLESRWGPGTINPQTGLREYFLSDIFNGVKSVLSVAQPVVNAISGIMGVMDGGDVPTNSAGYRMTGAGPGASGAQSLFGGGSGSTSGSGPAGALGDATLFNVGRTPITLSNVLDSIGAGLSVYGALKQNMDYQKQQDKLNKQWEQRQAAAAAPVDYDIFSDRPQLKVVGLAPSRPSELAGFGPEQPLVQRSYSHGGLSYAGGGPTDYAPGGAVTGAGDGQDDRVPAYLSRDEYVVPADVVSHLGNGSSNAGGDRLDAFVDHVRKVRSGSNRFPPRADGTLGRLMDVEGQ
jgi:hypothetical protein